MFVGWLGNLHHTKIGFSRHYFCDFCNTLYQGLKKLIQDKYVAANTSIDLIEKDPESTAFQAAAKELLEPTGAAQDPDVIQAAQELMAKAEPAKTDEGQFNVQIAGDVYGLGQSNDGEIKQTFNFGKKKLLS